MQGSEVRSEVICCDDRLSDFVVSRLVSVSIAMD